ncbi:MAG: hypothetical protein Q4G13_10090, partial [Moraxella sp.]|nr:hypothetical protein [Moraxella sp.]
RKNFSRCPNRRRSDSLRGGSSDSSSTTVTTTGGTGSNAGSTGSTTTTACTVENNGANVYGKNGSSCTFSIPNYNSGSTETLTCTSTGVLVIAGGISVSSGTTTLNNTVFTCRA